MHTKFISEVSSNHSCNIERALSFIDISSEIGCDAVKFQLFKIDQTFSNSSLIAINDVGIFRAPRTGCSTASRT